MNLFRFFSLIDIGKQQQDLRDLRTHLMFVLKRAGIRVYEPDLYNKDKEEGYDLAVADSLGIPYNILIDDKQSLTDGFLKLRNRETTLSETIHITDVPDYLLLIFRSS